MPTTDYDALRKESINRKYFRNKLLSYDPSLSADSSLLYGDAAEFKYRELVNSGAIPETPGGMFYNVKAYGAVGDGVTDDSDKIQQAIDAIPTGGGVLYFPAGDYAISKTLRLNKEGMTVMGDGPGNRIGGSQPSVGSRIRALSGFTGTALLLVQRVEDDRPLHGIHIHNIAVDGNNNGTAADGIIFRSNQGYIDHVSIWNCTGNGLKVSGYVSPAWDTYDSFFSHMLVGKNAGSGAYLDSKANDTHWEHNIFYDNLDNMQILGSSLQVTGCHFYSGDRYNIWFNGGGSRSKFVNCKIEGAAQHLVFIDSTNGGYSDIQFTGNGFSCIDQASTTNTYDYINVAGPSGNGISRLCIVGNNFNLKGGFTVKAKYAINLNGSAVQNCSITGNTFGPASHWGTNVINQGANSSSPPVIKGNIGLPDVQYPNVQSGTTYTVTQADADGILEMNNASAITVTIPPNSTSGLTKGTKLTITQVGAGTVTIAAGAGVTLRTVTPKTLVSKGQWATIRLYQRVTDNWIVEGDLA